MNWLNTRSMFLVMLLSAFVMGCGRVETTRQDTQDSKNHGHPHVHDQPASYAEAVTHIKEDFNTVKEAFAAGTPDACDDALHDLGKLLKKLPEFAGQSELSQADLDEVQSSADELFGLVGKLHEGFHDDGQGTAYDEVADRMNAELQTLESKIALAGEQHADDLDPNDQEH